MIKIGIVGHRFLQQRGAEKFIFRQCQDILMRAKIEKGNVIALSAIAEGADSIFADAAISLSIPLEIIKPFDQYETDFTTDLTKQCFYRLYHAASRITKLPYESRSVQAYFDAMQWVVNQSDLLVAVWDGKEARGKGGTADAVKLAMEINLDWIHLDVTDQSTKFFSGKRNLIPV